MIELVLKPEAGQFAVHTPFVVRSGQEVHLFYAKCDYPAGLRTLAFAKRYEIFDAVSRDGKGWKGLAKPVLSMHYSVCRPWVVEADGGWRMYFVRSWSPRDYRVWSAWSADLKAWTPDSVALFESFDGQNHLASPCVVEAGGNKQRMYFTGAVASGEMDSIYVAESADGKKFSVDQAAKYRPKKGSKYGRSCYTPFVFKEGAKWKMLFAGAGDDGRRRTFLAEGRDGVSFGDGREVIDLAGDSRFAWGAYKAVLFEDQVYFVGLDGDRRGAIYRAPRSDFGI